MNHSQFYEDNVSFYDEYTLTSEDIITFENAYKSQDPFAANKILETMSIHDFNQKSKAYRIYKDKKILSSNEYQTLKSLIDNNDISGLQKIRYSNRSIQKIQELSKAYKGYYIDNKITTDIALANIKMFAKNVHPDLIVKGRKTDIHNIIKLVSNLKLTKIERFPIVQWANTLKLHYSDLEYGLFDGYRETLSRHHCDALFQHGLHYNFDEILNNPHFLHFLSTDFDTLSPFNKRHFIQNCTDNNIDTIIQYIWKDDFSRMSALFGKDVDYIMTKYDLWTPHMLRSNYANMSSMASYIDSSKAVLKKVIVHYPEEKIPFLMYAIQHKRLHALCQFKKVGKDYTAQQNRFLTLSLDEAEKHPELLLAMFVYGCHSDKYLSLFSRHKLASPKEISDIRESIHTVLYETYGVDSQTFMDVMTSLVGDSKSDKDMIFRRLIDEGRHKMSTEEINIVL